MKCKICGLQASVFDRTDSIMGKYCTTYYNCSGCGFIFVDSAHWLQEAYGFAIADADVGLVSRNIYVSNLCSTLLQFLASDGPYLDYGGGYGLFTRLMRDNGYDFFHYDKYCKNVFAQGFDAIDFGCFQKYSLVTAWEIFEHLPDPATELDKMIGLGRVVLFSTELIPANIRCIKDWWYFSPETGQHISFYTEASLRQLAGMYQMKLVSNGHNIHIIMPENMNLSWRVRALLRFLSRPKIAALFNLMTRRRSLIADDYYLSKSLR